jgi:hypothetical protein
MSRFRLSYRRISRTYEWEVLGWGLEAGRAGLGHCRAGRQHQSKPAQASEWNAGHVSPLVVNDTQDT